MTTRISSPSPWAELGRRGFEYHRDLLGVELDLRISMAAVAPSRVEGMADVGVLAAWRGLRRHAGVPWPIAAMRAYGIGEMADKDPASFAFGVRPGPELGPGIASPVMTEFCRPGPPRIRFERGPGGDARYMLEPGGDDTDGTCDLTMGWVHVAAAPIEGDGTDDDGALGTGLSAPTRRLVHDLMVHESLGHIRSVAAVAFAAVPSLPNGEEAGGDAVRLPVHDFVEPLGPAAGARMPGEPRYLEIVARVLERLGRRVAEFRCFRYTLEYPPFGGQFLMTHPLRPPGERAGRGQ